MNDLLSHDPQVNRSQAVEDPFDRDVTVRTLMWLVAHLASPTVDLPGDGLEECFYRLGAMDREVQAGPVVAAVVRAQRELIDQLKSRVDLAEATAAQRLAALGQCQNQVGQLEVLLRRVRRRKQLLERRLSAANRTFPRRAARAVRGRIRRAEGKLTGRSRAPGSGRS